MSYSSYRTLTVTVAERVATVTLRRPEMMNAVGAEMHAELSRIFRDLAVDPSFDVVVLTGAGDAFCAGGDLAWMQAMIDDPALFPPLIAETKEIIFSALDLAKPLLCRMNGDAIGLGATLALCCDIIVASEDARFGDPHVRVGLAAGDGAALLLPPIVGPMRAKELLLTGMLLTADQAKADGIFAHVVPRKDLDAKVADLAAKLAGGASQAIRFTKTALNADLRKRAAEQMDMLMAYEVISSRSPDHAEGVAAMREKRRPRFGDG